MGRYDVRIDGGVRNADADVTTYHPATTGPVVLEIEVTGDLAEVTAADFARFFGAIPPGERTAQAVAKFQGGGPDEASGYVSNGEPPSAVEAGTWGTIKIRWLE
jgi:hypothetical protein